MSERVTVFIAICLALCLSICATSQSAPVLARTDLTMRLGEELAANGDFERNSETGIPGWTHVEGRPLIECGNGLRGSACLTLQSSSGKDWHGVGQEIVLNQTSAAPVLVECSSRAKDVQGTANDVYSLFVDTFFADGSVQWAQKYSFACGTHDWERGRVTLDFPHRPIGKISVYALFRNRIGTAWFDDLSVREIRSASPRFGHIGVSGIAPFQPGQSPVVKRTSSRDGLKMSFSGDGTVGLSVGKSRFPATPVSGFVAMDYAGNSDVFRFTAKTGPTDEMTGECPELGLKLKWTAVSKADHISIKGRLTDISGKDRSIVLGFVIPVDAEGWQWGDDIRRSRTINYPEVYSSEADCAAGSTRTSSRYPLGTVYRTSGPGLCIGADALSPAICRLQYNAGIKGLLISYDFGLSRETHSFPGSADFSFVIYTFEPEWGFRDAFKKYTRVFPTAFEVRSKDQGIWMPFGDISRIEAWKDFGFRYHEGSDNIPFDNANNILSLRYVEPGTWWMPMLPEDTRDTESALKVRERFIADDSRAHQSMYARASKSASMKDETGQPYLSFQYAPWCSGGLWMLNPNPAIAGNPNASSILFNDETVRSYYMDDSSERSDGEYLDSLEGYYEFGPVDYDRAHFAYASTPLTFGSRSGLPGIHRFSSQYEYTRWISSEMHSRGKLIMANAVPYRTWIFMPLLDIAGIEVNEMITTREYGNVYSPSPDSEMCFRRTLSGGKPYVLLQNSNFDIFDSSFVERYLTHSMFYGVLPGMFSADASSKQYFSNPTYYNRDRHLFRRYVPIITAIAEAGWEPVTGARCDNADIFLERFGTVARGRIFITVMNQSKARQAGKLKLDRRVLHVRGPLRLREAVSGRILPATGTIDIALEPGEVNVIEVTRGSEGVKGRSGS